jgi:uncharacterized protein (TIGR02466 family)
MKLQRFFPTTIGYFNDIEFTNKVLPLARETLVDVNKEDHIWEYKTTFSKEEKMRKISNTPFINKYIKNISDKFINSIGWDWLWEIEVQAFVTKMEKGDQHDYHNHPNGVLSGVCYLNTNSDCSSIVFEDPRNVRAFNSLKQKDMGYNIDNQNQVTFQPKNGDILIWESWLKHKVPINNCDCRETLVFNINKPL